MEKDKITFIEEKKLKKELEEKSSFENFLHTNPIKDVKSEFCRFRKVKKTFKPEDLI